MAAAASLRQGIHFAIRKTLGEGLVKADVSWLRAFVVLAALTLGACGPTPPDPSDSVPPDLTLPVDLVVAAEGSQGTVVDYQASAADAVDGAVEVSCDNESGTIFPVGVTAVTCTATDSAGNSASGAFTVTVRGVATKVTAGGYHSCSVTSDELAHCWGQNDLGQLGRGDAGPFAVADPGPVVDLAEVVDVDAGLLFTCGVVRSGSVFCWGDDSLGQLGDGTAGSPAAIGLRQPVVGVVDAVAVAAGAGHACAVLSSGSVSCWGSDTKGQLGDGVVADPPTRATPALVPGIENAVDIAVGPEFTCVLESLGGVQCWGDDTGGTLGDGIVAAPGQRPWPSPVAGIPAATSISAGADFMCATSAGGNVWCWGWDSFGQLGDGVANASGRGTPQQVVGVTDVVHVGTGAYHVCATGTDGRVWCWGRDLYGELGRGYIGPSNNPVPTTVIGLDSARRVDGGAHHTCVLITAPGVACWGSDNAGQLGDGTAGEPSDNPSPRAVVGL